MVVIHLVVQARIRLASERCRHMLSTRVHDKIFLGLPPLASSLSQIEGVHSFVVRCFSSSFSLWMPRRISPTFFVFFEKAALRMSSTEKLSHVVGAGRDKFIDLTGVASATVANIAYLRHCI